MDSCNPKAVCRTSELKDGDADADYTPASEMTSSQWIRAEKAASEELGQFLRAGGKPQNNQQLQDSGKSIIDQTLEMLDKSTSGAHFHEFPLFIVNDSPNSNVKYVLNRNWLHIQDFYRWLLTRPWWSRVWTLQEAILPSVDSTIHTSANSFRLSRLLNGLSARLEHSGGSKNCCRNLARLFQVAYLPCGSFSTHESRAYAVYEHRKAFFEEDPPWISISEVIETGKPKN